MLRSPTPALLLALCAPAAAQTTIDFELSAPCVFSSTVALSNEYAAQGVLFSGPAPGDGGCVVDECGNWGVNALSGTNFLGFNDSAASQSGKPIGPETITFSNPVSAVSIWVAGGYGSGALFQLDAYDGAVLVDSMTVGGASWNQLAVSGNGITHVVLDEIGSDAHWVADDLEFVEGSCETVYCDANPANAADLAIDTCATGAGSIHLLLSNAPANQFGYPMIGAGSSVSTDPPGAQGDLCLIGSPVGRYFKDASFTDAAGNNDWDIWGSVTGGGGGGIPNPPGGVLTAGQTWNFQVWHRDGMSPSKFSKAITVTFH